MEEPKRVCIRRSKTICSNQLTAGAWVIAALMGSGCANTMRGVKQDAERVTEKTAAAVETVDVKAALIADGRVDATNINVDTIASTKTVVLKGTVQTVQERVTTENIARDQAKGCTITNQLTVVAK